jgi:Zn-dependent protease
VFKSSYQVATVIGIPIKVHISLLLVVLLLANRFGLMTGILLEVGLVISIVLHELGHSVVALRKGCKVREITLLCIGGAAQMEKIPRRPLDEFQMAIAGPAVSLVLGLVGVYVGSLLSLPAVRDLPINLIQLLGAINLGLVLFNLLPSFPMDGGRILRAVLTPKMGRLRATFVAARLGKIMAVLFGIKGFFSGDWMLVFIAFFVFIAAANEYKIVSIQEAMRRQRQAWPGFGDSHWDDEPDDQVTISPAPFKRGRKVKADIQADD